MGWCQSDSEQGSLGLSGNLRGMLSYSSEQGQSWLLTSKAHVLGSTCSLTSVWDLLPFSPWWRSVLTTDLVSAASRA